MKLKKSKYSGTPKSRSHSACTKTVAVLSNRTAIIIYVVIPKIREHENTREEIGKTSESQIRNPETKECEEEAPPLVKREIPKLELEGFLNKLPGIQSSPLLSIALFGSGRPPKNFHKTRFTIN